MSNINKMRILGFIILLRVGFCANAQPYSIDPNFQPFFNIRNSSPNAGQIYDVLELKSSGKLFLAGDFNLGGSGIPQHAHFTQINRNGSFVTSFPAPLGGGQSRNNLFQINDNSFALVSNGIYLNVDSFGSFTNNLFNQTLVSTIPCRIGVNPVFFQNGSAIMCNDRGIQPNSCQIYSYNDTFPHQPLVRVNSSGLYDSSFKSTTNYTPRGIIKYDSNKLLVFGIQRLFTHYNGRKINGLCRVFLDGSIDTTFISPLSDTTAQSSFNVKVLNDGHIFLFGYFYLENDSGSRRTIIRLKPNGSLDTNFMNNASIRYLSNPFFKPQVNIIEETTDGGYLVGGLFDSFQGYSKNSIVKIDSNGIIESKYFNSLGPDSSIFFHQSSYPPSITGITKSKYGGYYVYGAF